MVAINEMVEEVYQSVKWQRLPRQLQEADFKAMLHNIIIDSFRYLYIMTGRSSVFRDSQFTLEDGVPVVYLSDQEAVEYLFIIVHSQILFKRELRNDVNNIVGYTTDAMGITNADKPFIHLSQEIDELVAEERRLFYKMIGYTMM